MHSNHEDVTVSLTRDQALVLFELLHRWEDEHLVSPPKHQAETVALWGLSASLEKELREPFNPRYDDLVSEARARLSATE
jgi:hypothetical protein